MRSRPSPSGKGLLVRPPCGQLDICPCCAAQPASLTACLAACPGAARPSAQQQLCHVVLLRARARADGRRGEKRTPDRGEGWAKQKNPGPQARPGPGPELELTVTSGAKAANLPAFPSFFIPINFNLSFDYSTLDSSNPL